MLMDVFSGPRIFWQAPVETSSTTLNVAQGEWLTLSVAEPGKWERVGTGGADFAFPNWIPTGRTDSSPQPDGSGTLTIPYGVFMARTTQFDSAVNNGSTAPGTRLRAKLMTAGPLIGQVALGLAGASAANGIVIEPPSASNDNHLVFANVLAS